MRGVLELCVLALIAERETYGYEIAHRLEAAGMGKIKGGTLYPILMRLSEDDLVGSVWRDGESGPGRKFFHVTDRGRSELSRRREEWAGFVTVTTALLTETAKGE